MASAIQVPGPCIVYWGLSAANPSFTELGQSDNDSMPQWDESVMTNDVEINTAGRTPTESIVAGIVGHLSMVLTQWDLTQWKSLNNYAKSLTSSTENRFPTIGALQVGTIASPGNGIFDIKVASVISGRIYRTFKYMRLRPTSLGPFGNNPTKLGLAFDLVRPSDATSTTQYILEGTV